MKMICPKCKSKNIIPIQYGYPSEGMWKKSMKGEIKLGGCTITPHGPDYYCRDCFNEFDSE